MALKLSCAFATSAESHEHARIAEDLGYARGFLTEAGFREIEVKPTFGYWSIVTGVKSQVAKQASDGIN